MIIRNTSGYPTPEVRKLVKFATEEIDMRKVCVNVKGSKHPFAGMAYPGVPSVSNAPRSAEYLMVCRIGTSLNLPLTITKYPRAKSEKRWPTYILETWQEVLIHLAAHEAKHIEQFREGLSRSEMACEHFAAYMLRRYREEI